MANPFPDLAPDDFEALRADIEKRGVIYPVVLDQHGNTIDGHQRQRACAALGVQPPTKTIEVKDDDEREELAIALNLRRRQLDTDQRYYYLRLLMHKMGYTEREAAKAAGVHRKTAYRAKQSSSAAGAAQDDEPKAQEKAKESGKRKRMSKKKPNGTKKKPVSRTDERITAFGRFLRSGKSIHSKHALVTMDKSLHEWFKRNNIPCNHMKESPHD